MNLKNLLGQPRFQKSLDSLRSSVTDSFNDAAQLAQYAQAPAKAVVKTSQPIFKRLSTCRITEQQAAKNPFRLSVFGQQLLKQVGNQIYTNFKNIALVPYGKIIDAQTAIFPTAYVNYQLTQIDMLFDLRAAGPGNYQLAYTDSSGDIHTPGLILKIEGSGVSQPYNIGPVNIPVNIFRQGKRRKQKSQTVTVPPSDIPPTDDNGGAEAHPDEDDTTIDDLTEDVGPNDPNDAQGQPTGKEPGDTTTAPSPEGAGSEDTPIPNWKLKIPHKIPRTVPPWEPVETITDWLQAVQQKRVDLETAWKQQISEEVRLKSLLEEQVALEKQIEEQQLQQKQFAQAQHDAFKKAIKEQLEQKWAQKNAPQEVSKETPQQLKAERLLANYLTAELTPEKHEIIVDTTRAGNWKLSLKDSKGADLSGYQIDAKPIKDKPTSMRVTIVNKDYSPSKASKMDMSAREKYLQRAQLVFTGDDATDVCEVFVPTFNVS